MKKINYILGAFAAVAMSLASCSPEEFDGVSEKGLPLVENYKVTAEVDQTINQVTFKLEGNGVYPIWFLTDGASPYSTQNGLKKIFNSAGDYTMKYRVGNRNGFSQGVGEVTFHIDNSLVDMTKYEMMLAGKTWRIAKKEQGHLGCGPSGTEGLEWYSAAPNDKVGTGLYDDEITFTADGSYTYNPGPDGLVFVNNGCTLFDNPNTGDDFDAAAEAQTAEYKIEAKGDGIYLVLPAQTMFPYISGDNQYNKPEFRIESITGSKLVLIYDDGNIAWHYILTNKADGEFEGYDYNSNFNMFKSCTFTNEFYYAHGNSWESLGTPEMTTYGNSYTVSLPTATDQQWQAQVKFLTDMSTSTASNYDFSCKLLSTTDHDKATVKLVKSGGGDNDNIFYFEESVKLKAYEEYIFYKSDMPGIDMDKVTVVFDFGGNAANTEVIMSDIVLKDHANDDGTVLPAE